MSNKSRAVSPWTFKKCCQAAINQDHNIYICISAVYSFALRSCINLKSQSFYTVLLKQLKQYDFSTKLIRLIRLVSFRQYSWQAHRLAAHDILSVWIGYILCLLENPDPVVDNTFLEKDRLFPAKCFFPRSCLKFDNISSISALYHKIKLYQLTENFQLNKEKKKERRLTRREVRFLGFNYP